MCRSVLHAKRISKPADFSQQTRGGAGWEAKAAHHPNPSLYKGGSGGLLFPRREQLGQEARGRVAPQPIAMPTPCTSCSSPSIIRSPAAVELAIHHQARHPSSGFSLEESSTEGRATRTPSTARLPGKAPQGKGISILKQSRPPCLHHVDTE